MTGRHRVYHSYRALPYPDRLFVPDRQRGLLGIRDDYNTSMTHCFAHSHTMPLDSGKYRDAISS